MLNTAIFTQIYKFRTPSKHCTHKTFEQCLSFNNKTKNLRNDCVILSNNRILYDIYVYLSLIWYINKYLISIIISSLNLIVQNYHKLCHS